MTKRLLAVLLCLVMLSTALVSCHDSKIDGKDVKGAEITMYLADMIYDFDPAVVYNNADALKLCSLMFDTLFKLDANGKVTPSIVDKYTYTKDENKKEYTLMLYFKSNNAWSDGTPVTAQDAVFTWKRLLDYEASYEAAALLYEIKNARRAKEGDCSIDDIGIYAVDELVLEIRFERDINLDEFLLNLTSVALAPLREDIVSRNEDWAKKPATIACSGPFKLYRINYGMSESASASMYLERNPYYRRNYEKDHLDKSVTPYRIIVDYSMTPEEQLTAYENGNIFYVGNIALSKRAEYKDQAKVSDGLSTHTYYLNETADIAKKDGSTEKLFANRDVRLALSAAIDRQKLADLVVFAEAATALVSPGIFDGTKAKTTFRSVGGDILSVTADTAKAQSLLSSAGVNASDYSFSITVRAENEVHCVMADAVAEAWNALGFNVTVDRVSAIINDDLYNGEIATDICDDIFNERLDANKYEVIALDLIAFSANPYSLLAPFAFDFSGQKLNIEKPEDSFDYNYILNPHQTGYNNEAYNTLLDQVAETTDSATRAKLLHDAEAQLLDDMPVIPLVFNQDAYLCSKDLSRVSSSYYGFREFTTTKQKNYMKYITVVSSSNEETTGSDDTAE